MWNKPDGGLHAYLVRFLSSADITFQHIAVWVGPLIAPKSGLFADLQTIVQLLEAEDEQLTTHIRTSPILVSSIRQLAASPPPSRAGQRDTSGSDDEFEDDGTLDQDGEGEISALARRILDLTEEAAARAGGDDGQSSTQREAPVGSHGSDHAALRASVHRALSGQ